ncbi:hypothetical protein QR680_014966 [Steinernema hermaphroditum]|uniref:Uncharacterized protein n=1 Tax=Steinernema hermaphroditum TaxID=289476 RepID=A0AA39M551_9BILA|nr:hypothetical protein QR680_014966 [Steinernema hermaphroditum]
MDTAPVNFVDRVVELFDLNKTIAPVVASVANPVWKRILQLHHRNRRSLRIRLRSVDGGIECAFYECVPSLLIPIKEIESGGRRFVRISGVDLDDSVNSFPKHAKIILQNGEDLFKMMSQYIVDGSPPNFISYSRPPSTFQTTVVTSLHQKIYFTSLHLYNDGAVTENFLKDQIENDHVLHTIHLYGSWPSSILPYTRRFISQNRSGTKREATLFADGSLVVQPDFIKKLIDEWNLDDGSEGKLFGLTMDEHIYPTFMNRECPTFMNREHSKFPPSFFATENCLIDIQEKCAFFFICSDDYDRFNLVANFWVVGTSVPLCLHNPTP